MVKEKGASPLRRLPSRSGRASFEGDPTDGGAPNGDVAPSPGATGESEKTQEQQQPSSSGEDNNNASGADARAGPPASKKPATVAVTPRGRGRPRKKPLEQPVKGDTAATAAAAASPRTDGSSPATSPRSDGSSPRAVDGWETAARPAVAARKEKETGEGGNESDEWSDHDEVHDLPDEIKAQFGQVGCGVGLTPGGTRVRAESRGRRVWCGVRVNQQRV